MHQEKGMTFSVPSIEPDPAPIDYEIHSIPVTSDSRRLTVLVALTACVTLCSVYLAVRGTDKPAAHAVAPATESPRPKNAAQALSCRDDSSDGIPRPL
jgi:hypothetical protein